MGIDIFVYLNVDSKRKGGQNFLFYIISLVGTVRMACYKNIFFLNFHSVISVVVILYLT